MILEVIFWIAFIAVSQSIAKIYFRRRDVLYGPHRSRGFKAGEWGRRKINQWDSESGRRGLEYMASGDL
jgi:hypothetical protein